MTDAASPAPSDAELRETLDRLASLTLTLSDQVEEQTKAINKVTTLANEARHAAKRAEEQTDPEQYAEFAVSLIDDRMDKAMERVTQVSADLIRASSHTQNVLKDAEKDQSVAQRQVWEREQKVDRLKTRLPWFGLGAVVLALALSVLLPCFLASNASVCAVLGASWTTTTTGVDACVFYRE